MGGIPDAIGDALGAVGDFFSSAFSAIGSALGGLFGGVPVPDFDVPEVEQDTGPQGVTVTKTGSQVAIPVVYGFRRVGGRIIFAETNGTRNSFLYVIYAVAEGEIRGINRIHIQDIELPRPSGGLYTSGQKYNITSGRFANRLQLQVFNNGLVAGLGSNDLAKESASWGQRSRGAQNMAYVVCRFEWKEIKSQDDADANPYRGGIPTAQFDVLGKKVYDVTQHSSGADLSADYGSLSKTANSYNPVSNLLDYLMNPVYGCGIPKEEIDADSFKRAAIKCNQSVQYSTGTNGKAITCNAVMSTKSTLFDNVKRLLIGTRGFMPFIQGRYKINIEDGGNATDITSSTLTSAFDVTEKHLMGDVALKGEDKQNKYNQVIVRYIDPDLEFSEQEVSYTESADVTADGEDLIGEFDYHTISNRNQATDIARLIYKKSRNQRFLSFSATPELLEVEPGDIITVTSTVLNLSQTTFRVLSMSFTKDGFVSIQAREHIASLYPFVQNEQIVLPSQTYKPSVYSMTPLAKTNPVVPIGVAPPLDNEDVVTGFDSAGVPITQSSNTSNNTLPQSADVGANRTVTQFIGTSLNGSVDDSPVNSTLLVGGNYTINYNNWLAGLIPSITNWSWIQGITNGPDTFAFAYHPPEDSMLDTLRLYYYNRSDNSLQGYFDKNVFRRDRANKVQISLVTEDTYIVPRFRNSYDNKEYADGSANSTATITYTNLNNQSVTGTGLEAAINEYIQRGAFKADPNTSVTFHNLGG